MYFIFITLIERILRELMFIYNEMLHRTYLVFSRSFYQERLSTGDNEVLHSMTHVEDYHNEK